MLIPKEKTLIRGIEFEFNEKVAVMSIMTPTISDLVALAPTNPMIISKEEIGAARTS